MCGGLHIILPRQRAFCQSHSSNGSPDSKLIISYGSSSVSHSAVSSLTRLCNTLDCSPPGSSVHRILQARILKWVAIPFSRRFPNPGIKPGSLALQADSLPSEPPGKLIHHMFAEHLLCAIPEPGAGEKNRAKQIWFFPFWRLQEVA